MMSERFNGGLRKSPIADCGLRIADWKNRGSRFDIQSPKTKDQRPKTKLPIGNRKFSFNPQSDGFTLIELVIAITILTILTLGIIPLVKVSVKRQKEAQLREALREMREAIKEFKRDTAGMEGFCGNPNAVIPTPNSPTMVAGVGVLVDPRSHVMVTDCTLFNLDNPDRYPPKLETLVEGVKVRPRVPIQQTGVTGLNNNSNGNSLPTLGSGDVIDKKKVYLRQIPVDPMTGKAEWDLRSCYDAPDATSWGGENVFDVRSKSTATALNGEKYSDW